MTMSTTNIKASLIITHYKRVDFLEQVMKSIAKQSTQDFEVIIAEDADDQETVEFVKRWQQKLPMPLKHASQPDNGFQRAKCINNGVKLASGELLVFIDGDCVLHPQYMHEYISAHRENICLYGRRVNLSEGLTQEVINQDKPLSLINILLSRSSRKEDGIYFPTSVIKRPRRGITGHSIGISRAVLEKVNGFDEDFTSYGAEETDLENRLEKLGGIEFVSLRMRALQYHLWHPTRSNPQRIEVKDGMTTDELAAHKATSPYYYCKNGLVKLKDGS
ncbi:glycosyltransferase [Vibrio sp. SCSIO 43136]|uniref:glycosyltransferase n=1 Tax=Vibrio sp. SCSIO 43136 TaxID=2819101 RepID=UPI002075E6C9|nr:glycosyltransferase [Vibrio sp. SCSIO 43136]USD65152.1 glycosyltransferase [Vibrio sp. SCSIO 43136]